MESVPFQFCVRVTRSLSVRNTGCEQLSALGGRSWGRVAPPVATNYEVTFHVDVEKDAWNCTVLNLDENPEKSTPFEKFLRIPRECVRFDKVFVEDKPVFLEDFNREYSFDEAVLPVLDSLAQQRHVRRLVMATSKSSMAEIICERLHKQSYFQAIDLQTAEDEQEPFKEIFFEFVKDQNDKQFCRKFTLEGSWPKEIFPWVISTLQSRNVSIVLSHPRADYTIFERLLDWWTKLENPATVQSRLRVNATFNPNQPNLLKGYETIGRGSGYQLVGRRHVKDPTACVYAFLTQRSIPNIELNFGTLDQLSGRL